MSSVEPFASNDRFPLPSHERRGIVIINAKASFKRSSPSECGRGAKSTVSVGHWSSHPARRVTYLSTLLGPGAGTGKVCHLSRDWRARHKLEKTPMMCASENIYLGTALELEFQQEQPRFSDPIHNRELHPTCHVSSQCQAFHLLLPRVCGHVSRSVFWSIFC